MAYRRTNLLLILLAVTVSLTGCGSPTPLEFTSNEVEWLKQEKVNLGADERFPKELRQEVDQMMAAMFGTPDHVRIPPAIQNSGSSDSQIMSLKNLQHSAGAVASDRHGLAQGLFREHCAHCHGITGDGHGPGSTVLYPYPRDFRLGKFKFKSTPQRHPPTDTDLKQVLTNGIPGTAMPSFRLLPEEEILALVDYVKYLSIRGQVERYLLNEVAHLPEDSFFPDAETAPKMLVNDLPKQPVVSELGQRLSTAQATSGELWEYLQTNYEGTFQDTFNEYVRDRWANVNQADFLNPQTPPWLAARNEASSDETYEQKLQRGKELFLGKGTCYQCHGSDGTGNGELAGYDAWTDDWIKSPGVDIQNQATFDEFIKAGAHHPQLARPRNLRHAVYRGGADPAMLYLRIAYGIEGSPMPAASALQPDEIWSLVAFVLEVPKRPDLLRTPATSSGGQP